MKKEYVIVDAVRYVKGTEPKSLKETDKETKQPIIKNRAIQKENYEDKAQAI